MKILVFSRNKKLSEKLRLRKRKNLIEEVRFLEPATLASELKAVQSPTLCYLDTASLEESKLNSCLKMLRQSDSVLYGVIDSGGKVKDVARLFHEGAVDYVGRRLLSAGVGTGRIKPVAEYGQSIHPEVLQKAAASADTRKRASYIPSGSDWTAVRVGREYSFAIMFIELDGKDQMQKNFGQQNLSIALASFRKYIEGFVHKFAGRIWMWTSFGGIILFPFDARTCPALTCGFRLMVFKHLYDVEESRFPHVLSFRTVLQIGSTTYTKEDTGHVVSDSLNSIFHLGQQYVHPGNFCVSEEVLQFGHPALRTFFVSAGSFEGRKILRMRLPVHRHKRKGY